MMLESSINFDVNSICDGGLKGWNYERNQSMTQRDIELISNLNQQKYEIEASMPFFKSSDPNSKNSSS